MREIQKRPRRNEMTADLLPDAAWRGRFRRRLRAWYARHRRDLPWRETRDPYAVWVSEIMLQQTQVVTVVGYFERFMAKFPTIAALAAADEQQVLRLWEGLGYYRRARQLHSAARVLVRENNGRFPSAPQAVRALPGIGRYTAGAILSIAMDAREPILEANTIRLYSRLLAYDGEVTSAAGQRMLWSMAEALLPRSNSGELNQALMELGSEICTPKSPHCDCCPVAMLCPTFAQGLQQSIPRPSRRQAIEAVREAAVVVFRRGQVLLRRCGSDERWAGLWDFPRFAVKPRGRSQIDEQLTEGVRDLTGITAQPEGKLTTIKHSVTRYRITLECHRANYISGRIRSAGGSSMRWISPRKLDDVPLSTTGRKLGKLISELDM